MKPHAADRFVRVERWETRSATTPAVDMDGGEGRQGQLDDLDFSEVEDEMDDTESRMR